MEKHSKLICFDCPARVYIEIIACLLLKLFSAAGLRAHLCAALLQQPDCDVCAESGNAIIIAFLSDQCGSWPTFYTIINVTFPKHVHPYMLGNQ